MTDQEINEAVARKLGVEFISEGDPRSHDAMWHSLRCPDYCHSIEAAWEIVRYCEEKLVLYQIDLSHSRTSDNWFCALGTKNQINESVGADTAPMAICLAFLKLP